MEEVLPTSRSGQAFRMVATGVFGLLGLAITLWGLKMALLPAVGDDRGGGVMLAVIGALTAAVFGGVFVGAWRTARSPGLLLTPEGYQYGSHRIGWADIEGFDVVGSSDGLTHVRVNLRPGADVSRVTKVTDALGRGKLYLGATFIPLSLFDTGGTPLPDILIRWWQQYRER